MLKEIHTKDRKDQGSLGEQYKQLKEGGVLQTSKKYPFLEAGEEDDRERSLTAEGRVNAEKDRCKEWREPGLSGWLAAYLTSS